MSGLPSEPFLIRYADLDDLPPILTIYNDVILTTTAVYSEAPVSLADRRQWFLDKQTTGFPVIVAVRGEKVIGYGTFGNFRPWACYSLSVEHSLHVSADARQQGVGRRILEALIERASAMDMHVTIAGIDSTNLASIALHQALGFEHVGTIREVGRKFGRWLDLTYMRKGLEHSASHFTPATAP
jgi:L-amino acid N-acyltransferase YncA